MFGRSQPETRSHIAHAPSTRSIQSARVSDCRSAGWKAGFEIELMAPRVASRLITRARPARSGASSIPGRAYKVPESVTAPRNSGDTPGFLDFVAQQTVLTDRI